ncbi:MAG: transglutaminase-like domain-containing protein [Candidatus Woesearchaeota archaeon]
MRNKFINFLIIFLISIISIIQVSANDFDKYKTVVMDVEIGSDFEIVPLSDDPSIEYINIDLSFYPKETQFQEPLSLVFTPEAEIEDSIARFNWRKPVIGTHNFIVESKVKVENDFVKINKKIPFPIQNLDEEYEIYASPSDNIDSDNIEIEKLASSLASGEDDLYIVVDKIAYWVEDNIEYSLDTLTAKASQPASWVLENRRGVCDELTSLFIALSRSVGIPARYISGMAFTNYNNMDNWGPHAWAEVYFPDHGWVAYDITYNQFGSIDPSHLILKESIDSDEPSTDYEWKSRDVDIETNKLDIKIEAIDKYGEIEDNIAIKADIYKDEIGFGSYNLVEAEVENLNDYYYSTDISMAQVDDLMVFDKLRQHIVLKPLEKKKLMWKIKLNEDMNNDYVYTIPVFIYSVRNETDEIRFTSKKGNPIYKEELIDSIIEQRQEEEEKTYSRKIDLICESEKSAYYIYEEPILTCIMKNRGNTLIEDLNICINEDKCRNFDIGISQEKKTDFLIETDEIGKKDIIVTASNQKVSKSFEFALDILDEPTIVVDEMHFPEDIGYKEIFNVSFILKKESYSVPKQIKILLKQKHGENEWGMQELESDEKFVLTLFGKDLSYGDNDFTIYLEYFDDNGKIYEEREDFIVKLSNITFPQRITIMLNDFAKWFESIFND